MPCMTGHNDNHSLVKSWIRACQEDSNLVITVEHINTSTATLFLNMNSLSVVPRYYTIYYINIISQLLKITATVAKAMRL